MGLLEELLMAPGVPGFEGPVREIIVRELGGMKHAVDGIGNLHYVVGEGGKRLMVMAHMDEVGMVVARIEDNGTLRFRRLGGLDEATLRGRHVRIHTGEGEVGGVVAQRPPHLFPPSERGKRDAGEEMYIDVGASSRKEVMDLGIRELDPVTPVKTITRLANGMVSARGLDDRAGCLALIRVLKVIAETGVECEVHCVFTVQEELGLRGARAASLNIRPNVAVAIDSMTVPGRDGLPRNVPLIEPGSGAALRLVDSRSVASLEMRRALVRLAGDGGIPLTVSASGGSTDAAEAQAGGALTMPVCFPVRYTHTMVETASMRDVDAVVSLVCELIAHPEVLK